MKIAYFALFLLVMGLVFFGLGALIRKLSYSKSQRYLHCRIIPAVVLVLFAATNTYTVSFLLKGLDKIIGSPVLKKIIDLLLPQRAFELVYMLLVTIGLNLAVMLLVILTVLAVKLIFVRHQSFVDINDYEGAQRLLHLPWLITAQFYDEEKGEARLNAKGHALGLWASGLKIVFAAVWAGQTLCIAYGILWGTEFANAALLAIAKAWYLLPMAGYLMVDQIQRFLEGVWDDEAGTFGSAEIGETQEGGMEPLQQAYQQTFGATGALLYSGMGTGARQEQDGLGSNDLGNRQIADCTQPEVLNVIFNQLRECDASQNEQYRNAVVELLNGHCVNICDQCEGDFLVFLAGYLNFYMAQGRTALMLCRNKERAEQLCQALNREMKRLNGLYTIWNVCTLEGTEVNSRMSMLVCSFDDFLNYHICQKRPDYISDLFCTVIADGMDLFSRDAICAERLFSVLRSIEAMKQYVLFSDVDNDALRTAMEQAAKCEILPFNGNTANHPNTGIMVWREESYHQLQRKLGIGNALSPYMGTALPLALVAAKYDLPQMYVIREDSRGDKSFDDVLSMSSKEVSRYVAKNVNLKSVIRYELDEALKQQELSMTIAYDTDYNFLNAVWRWMRYSGTNSALLHIVSPAYALREYFAANLKSHNLLLKNNEYDALISSRLGMKISHMAVLLVSLCDKGMTEEELMEKSKEYHWEYNNVEELLRDCLSLVLSREEIHSVYECFHFEAEKHFREDTGEFTRCTRITLTDDTIRRRMNDRIGYVTLVSKNDQQQRLPILRCNVYNHYLREQIIAVGGYLYQIRDISEGNVYAEQTLPQDVPEYFQISQLEFDNYQIIDNCVDTGFMDMNICTAGVRRNIYGYWSSNRGNCFAGDCSLLINDLRDPQGAPLSMGFKCANILEINIRRAELGDRAVEAVRLLAYLLKDISKTLFPMTHQNLFVAVSEGVDEALPQRVLNAGKDSSLDDIVCSLIPSVGNKRSDDPDFITLYVVEASCIEYGMVQMLYSRYKTVMLMLREYLSWYKTSNAQQDALRGSYLHFGAEEIPGALDLEGVLRLCRKLMPEESKVTEQAQVEIQGDVKLCTFCGRPSLFPVRLSDGRLMCGHCKDHQLTQQDEIRTMFRNTVKFITEGYQISLPKNIHVRFQSADAIAKATGGSGDGRILGFYNSGNHQLWLEARGPRIAMQSTLIHELTHAWQHDDPVFSRSFQRMLRKFPKKKRPLVRLLILEGHAVYMEIDTMRKMHENAFADRMHEMTMARQDEYGVGYRMLREYIIEKGEQGSHMTPYVAVTQLLQDVIDGTVTIDI